MKYAVACLLLLSCTSDRRVAVSTSYTDDEFNRIRSGVRLWGPVTFTRYDPATQAPNAVTFSRWPGDDTSACRYLDAPGEVLGGVTVGFSEVCIDANIIGQEPFPTRADGVTYDGWVGVAAHEMGHVLGIVRHTPDEGTVMNGVYGHGSDRLTDEDWAAYEAVR